MSHAHLVAAQLAAGHDLTAAVRAAMGGVVGTYGLAVLDAEEPDVMVVGRVRGWPVAREGAQKLKEVSYLQAEAYPAAELKHGPPALVGPQLPTVAVVPDDELLDKNVSTLMEIRTRRGGVLTVAHRELPAEVADHTIVVPKSEPELDPILLGIPLQLLAYHDAVTPGRDVDRPRSLAKSVTVEYPHPTHPRRDHAIRGDHVIRSVRVGDRYRTKCLVTRRGGARDRSWSVGGGQDGAGTAGWTHDADERRRRAGVAGLPGGGVAGLPGGGVAGLPGGGVAGSPGGAAMYPRRSGGSRDS